MKKKTSAVRGRGRPRNDSGLSVWIGPTLRHVRIDRGLTVEDLAAQLGINSSSVYRWERFRSDRPDDSIGGHAPTREQVRAIANVLRVPQITFSRQAKLTFKS